MMICISILPVFNKLLERVELSVRLVVGVGVALLFELARESSGFNEGMMESADSNDTYALIEQLATESNRHTSRKDRNQTRSCFRDILLSLDVSALPVVALGWPVVAFHLHSLNVSSSSGIHLLKE